MTQKQRQILIKSLSWFITLFIIIFIGITGVFADTYNATQFTVEGYDNYGPSLSKVTTDFTNNSWRWTIPTMTANSAGTAFIFNSPIPLISNHTYTLTAQIENSWGTCITLSSFNRIGLGTTISNSKSSYENNTNVNENYSNSSSCNIVQFAFTPTVNGTWLTVPFSTTSNSNNVTFTINELIIDDLGSKSLTQDEINNSLTNQTNILNSNINAIGQDTSTIINQNNQINNNINAVGQDTSTIINQNNNLLDVENQNKQDIINNQNTNTDKQIESQQVCNSIEINNSYIINSDSWLDNSGVLQSRPNSIWGVTDYLSLSENSTLSIISALDYTTSTYSCFYDINKSVISCFNSNYNNGAVGEVSIASGAKYVRLSIQSDLNRPIFKLFTCQNGNQALNDSLDEQNKTSKGILGKIGDLFNTLFSNEDADISGLDNMVGWLPPGPVDSIINLPLSLFNALTNTLSGSCTPISLTLPFVNANLTLPCFDTFMSQYLTGFSTFWNWLGITVSVFILYNYLLNLYKWIDDTLTMRENNLPGYYDDNMWGGA